MLCTLYSNAKNLICARTLRSFLILFETPLCAYHLYFISLGILLVLNDIEGVRMPCLCILYSNANSNLCTNLGELPHII